MTRDDRGLSPVGRWLRDLSRAAQWHRRLLSAGLLAGSLAVGLDVLAPPPPATVPALVASRDLAAGGRLAAGDLAVVRRTPDALPDGALTSPEQAIGVALTSGTRRGEVLTDARLLGPSTLRDLGPGLVAMPVRIADAEAVGLVRPGALVDVLAAGASAESVAPARLVASAVRVLAVPRQGGDGLARQYAEGALLVLAATEATAARLAGAAVSERLSVVLRAH